MPMIMRKTAGQSGISPHNRSNRHDGELLRRPYSSQTRGMQALYLKYLKNYRQEIPSKTHSITKKYYFKIIFVM